VTAYRLYYCREDIPRFNAHHFQATNDSEAINHTDQRVVPLHVPIYELWQGNRLVLRWDHHNLLAHDDRAASGGPVLKSCSPARRTAPPAKNGWLTARFSGTGSVY
jgi:hypothetical protein